MELRHTLEGHALGVVSVDINQQGTSILHTVAPSRIPFFWSGAFVAQVVLCLTETIKNNPAAGHSCKSTKRLSSLQHNEGNEADLALPRIPVFEQNVSELASNEISESQDRWIIFL